jgi:hypothetical protein
VTEKIAPREEEAEKLPLFKYMSAEVAPLFSKSLKVRFTQPSDLNDPFEFRPLIDFEGTAVELRPEVDARLTALFGTVDGTLAMMEKQQRSDPNYPKMAVPIHVFRQMIAANPKLGEQFMAEMGRHKTEVLDTITKAVVWEVQWEKFQQVLGQVVGIFSLTEDPAHPLMWSHYASQHRGIVIELDENNGWFDQRLAAADELRHVVKVAYAQDPHPRTWKQLAGTDLLYTKYADWSYEREWRIIRPVKDGTEVSPGVICFDVPPDAVRSIIFGCRTTPTVEKEIRDCIAANPALKHVRFKRAKIVGGGKIELVDDTAQ